MTPNRRLIAQYSDVYRPIIDIRASFARTYNRGTRVHARKCLRVCVCVCDMWSQQPNVTPNLRQRMQHRSMRIRRRENTIELSRILFDCRATASRADDNPQGQRSH